MTDDAPRWFDDEADPPARPRRRSTLLVVAVVPWIVLALVLLRGPGPTAPDDPLDPGGQAASHGHHGHAAGATPPHAAAPGHPASPGPGAEHGPDDTPDGLDRDPDGDPHGEPTEGDGAARSGPEDARGDGHGSLDHPTRVAHGVAEALVIAVTRAWLSDAGPDLEVDGVEVDRSGYLEHVAVERISLEGEDLAVATVTVVLLDRDGDRYAGANVRRAAVPLRVTPTTVHPAGQPWWLPSAVDLTALPPEVTAVDDDTVAGAVDEALAAAGYGEATVDGIGVTGGGTLVAAVTAATPDGVPVRSAVWLRLDPGGAATVLGHHDDDTT